MTTITITIPDDLKTILDEVDFPIYLDALKVIAGNRLAEKENKLAEMSEKLRFFEQKYNQTFTAFSNNVPVDVEAHEDWIDWTYLNQVYEELSQAIGKYRLILNK